MPQSLHFSHTVEIWQEKGCFSFLRGCGKAYSSVKRTMQSTKTPEMRSPSTYVHLNAIEPDGLCLYAIL